MGNFFQNTLKTVQEKVRKLFSSSKDYTLKKNDESHDRVHSPIQKEQPSCTPAAPVNRDESLAPPVLDERIDPAHFEDDDNILCDFLETPARQPNEEIKQKKREKKETTPSLHSPRVKYCRPWQVTGDSGRSRTVKIRRKRSKGNKEKNKKTVSIPVQEIIRDGYCIAVQDHIVANPTLAGKPHVKKQIILSNVGVDEQIADASFTDEREIVIGLDFGTSSVKVVIGDKALGKAFAVPFTSEIGLDAFLLPSRVWQDDEGYSLTESGNPLRNLKLQLIEESCSLESFSNSAAFLALVIRHARGWLFSEKEDIYRKVKIYWKLTLGLPAESYNNKNLVDRFEKLAAASWWLSKINDKRILRRQVENICTRVVAKSFNEIHALPELNMIDFDVVPELSAQIYGFLKSTRFDPNARNIFMMVDVGAGTVDSSIFHVQTGRGDKLSFNFYANFVEFNGVANLNANRINWLRKAFRDDIAYNIDSDLEMMEVPTDFLEAIPEEINDYFDGIDFLFDRPEKNPDAIFFTKRVKQQVTARTLQTAHDKVTPPGGNRAISGQIFKDAPLFLCGGGSRMKFYQKLEKDLTHHPNATWFRFIPRRLEIPEALIVPGVVKEDFDRLSVAFGLSFLQVGKIVREVPRVGTGSSNHDRHRCPGCKAVGTCYCG